MASIRRIIKLVNDGNCAFVGLRGRGKDMLQGNVIMRRKKDYISNVDYGSGKGFSRFVFNPKMFDVGNTYKQFIEGTVKRYVHPFADDIDVYISDCGVYFPSTYQKELCREYASFPVYMALSRQLGESNVHFNVQNLNRCWDKIREQCDTYIMCDKCIYIPWLNIVIQRVTVYDNEEACTNRREPFLIRPGLLTKREQRDQIRMQKLNYISQNGHIDRFWLIYRNKSSYNTRIFKEILENGI